MVGLRAATINDSRVESPYVKFFFQQYLLSKSLGELVTKVWSGSYLQCDPTDLYTAITSQFSSHLTPQRQVT